jgi:carbamoyl-phosphate synthase large subunit
MIRKEKPTKVLILGSGALQIGQAGEFDYSGSQAIKALKEDKIATVLINPNIATVQTSENFADKIYFLPVNFIFAKKVIEKEKPDAILLGFGGQTALNVGIELYQKGILEKFNIKVLGTPIESIINTEDRSLFNQKVREIDLKVPQSVPVTSVDEAVSAASKIGYPVMCRIAYALGGLGSGIVSNEKDLIAKVTQAFSFTEQILIEESLYGWKEVEYEIVRDKFNNCITVCSMENVDPMGIHTGDSIVVAPVQTLSAKENFKLRSIGIKLIRHLGIIGECNIQYAIDPHSDDYRIIEVNARLSRSSALASKATGYPLAFIATKLSLSYALHEIVNQVTQETSACFEPALDYIALKIPRWDIQKFQQINPLLGSEMKSIGEVMSIARNFEEALQKAIRMLNRGFDGLVCNDMEFDDLDVALKEPTEKRIFAVAEAMKRGYSIDRINNLSKINHWFLYKVKNIVDAEKKVAQYKLDTLPKELLREAKKMGFSDKQIAVLTHSTENEVRIKRKILGIIPVIKQIDTMAAEFDAKTNYLYMTYNGDEDDIESIKDNQIIVLGSGPYSIGSSVEFDWCCVNTILTLNKLKFDTIMINCNPETVSTDYDICSKLYFEELSFERVMDIYEKETPVGIIVSMGGQIPNNLALKLHHAKVKILGTSPEQIDRAEDRHKFSDILDKLKIDQPEWSEFTDLGEAKKFAENVGYPVLLRPSYVLSGSAMSIVLSESELETFIQKASNLSPDHPVIISKFITDAHEIEFDAVAQNGNLFCYAIAEHIENAGVHSGDATLVFPAQRTYLETIRKIKRVANKIASELNITGPFNIQFIAKNNEVKVIECNLRASRSFPFVSKTLKLNFVDIAVKLMLGEKIDPFSNSAFELDYVGVKAPQFSFTRLKGSDPILGVEMASTGEAACLGDDFEEAFLKSLIATGINVTPKSVLLSTGSLKNKINFLAESQMLVNMGINLFATEGTANFLKENNLPVTSLSWQIKNNAPEVISFLQDKKIDLVINIPKNSKDQKATNDYNIRRKAVDLNISLISNLEFARRYVRAIHKYKIDELKIKSWDEYL